jgi:sugar lactone lactonase YvrE
MQGLGRIHLYFLCVTLTAALFAGWAGTGRAQENARVVGDGLTGTAGLVLDSRGYAYTVNREAGLILCVPPGGKPMTYARLAEPTALAVDRLRTLFAATASGDIYTVAPDGAVSRVFRCGSPVTGLSIDRDGNLLAVTGKGVIIRVTREALRFSD